MLIKHEAKPSALFRIKQEQANAFIIIKNFQRITFIKTCLLVHCNLNGASLFMFVSYNYAQAYVRLGAF